MVKEGYILIPTNSPTKDTLFKVSFTEGKHYTVRYSDELNDLVVVDDEGDEWASLSDRIQLGLFDIVDADDIIEKKMQEFNESGNYTALESLHRVVDAIGLSFKTSKHDLVTLIEQWGKP